MVQSREDTEKHISWIVGQGEIDIYRDKCLDYTPTVYGHHQKVRDLFISSKFPNENISRVSFGDDAYNEIMKKDIRLTLEKDFPIWNCTQSGMYTLHSPWQEL